MKKLNVRTKFKFPSRKIQSFLVGLLALIAAAALFVKLTSKPAQAVWYNDSYQYRKAITFTNTGSADTNKKVLIAVDTAALITASKLQSDCDDTRFTDINGLVLEYYINVSGGAGVGCNDSSTDYYVLIPSIPVGTTLIYMYYGNPSAASTSRTSNFAEATFSPNTGPTLGTEELSPGPVSYWKFDEGTDNTCSGGTNDTCDSMGVNDGALSGALWQTEDLCFSGKCLWFDGSNDDVSDSSFTSFTGDLTISLWFKATEQSDNNRLFDLAQAGSGGLNVFMNSSGHVKSDNTGGPTAEIGTSTNYGDNAWHHLAITRSSTTYILYIDGQSRGFSGGTAPTYTRLFLGRKEPTNQFFKGFLDEFKIYNYARSDSQIKNEAASRGNSKTGSAQLGATNNESSTLTDNLMGYWKMNESSTGGGAVSRTDSSGNTNTLTDNGTTPSNAGKYGLSPDMTPANTEYLNIADNATLSTGDIDFTISAWVYLDTKTANRRLVTKRNDNVTGEFDLLYLQASDTFRIDLRNSSDTQIGVATSTSFGSPSTATWYFVTAWHDSVANTVSIQVNDGPVDTSATTGSPADTGEDFRIGAYRNNSTIHTSTLMDGRIDEVRFYKRVLSPTERTTLYNWGPGPVGYWKLDENTGTTANDSSGLSNSCTLSNLPNGGWVPGKYGSGINFNGGYGTLSRSDDSDFDFAATDNFTIEAWVKHNGTMSTSNDVIMSKADVTNGGYKMYMDNSGDMCFAVEDSGSFANPGIESKVGNFSTSTTTGVQSVTGVGFRPKALILYGTYSTTEDSFVSHSSIFQSFSDGTRTYSWAAAAEDGITLGGGTPSDSRHENASRLITMNPTASTMLDGQGTISFTDDGFNIDWAEANDNAYETNYIAIGGTEVQAYTSSVDPDDLSTTAPGFNPDLVLFGTVGEAANTGGDGGNYAYGATDGTRQWTFDGCDEDGLTATTNNIREGSASRILNIRSGTNCVSEWDLAISSLDSTGFTWTVGSGTPGTDHFGYLAIGLGARSARVDTVAKSTGAQPSTNAISGFGFQPQLVGMASRNSSVSGNSANYHYSLGAFTATGEGSACVRGSDNSATSDFDSHIQTDKAMEICATGSAAVDAEADGTSMDADGFTLTWTTNTGTAILYGYWAIQNDATQAYDSACTSAVDFDDSQWHHVVGTKTGTSRIDLHVDGVLRASDTSLSTTATTANANALYIGTDRDGASYGWNGQIDEIKIYNYNRTARDISQDLNANHPPGGSPTGSMLGWWKFDERVDNSCSGGSNDTCNSGSLGTSLDGAQSNMASPGTSTSGWQFTGKVNGALAFDNSNDVVNLGSTASIDSLSAFTVSAWIRPNTSGEGGFGRIIQKAGDNSTDAKGWTTYVDAGTFNLAISYNSDVGASTRNVTCTATGITYNTWQHVAITWDGTLSSCSGVKMYHNGNLRQMSSIITGTLANKDSDAAYDLLIGNEPGGTRTFDGLIDEVKLYDYALTASEIAVDMNYGSATSFGGVLGTQDNDGLGGNAPVAEWKLDENTGTATKDTSGNANNSSTFTGNPAWTTGRYGSALSFDGTDDVVRFPESTSTDVGGIGTSYSVSLWFKASVTPGGVRCLVCKWASSTGARPIAIFASNSNNISTEVSDGTITVGNSGGAGELVSDNKWYHVAFVRNATTDTLYLYMNGNLIDSDNDTTTATTANDADISIANGGSSYVERDFIGSVDQVKIFNYALNPAQVAWDYNRGQPTAWWKLDECQGTTAGDSAQLPHNGTISIGASGTHTSPGTCGSGSASEAWDDGATGQRNYSLDLDGTDDLVNLGDINYFNMSGEDFTLAGWFNRETFTTDDGLIGKRAGLANGSQGYLAWIDDATDKVTFEVCDANATCDEYQIESTSTFTSTGWNHFVIVWDNDSEFGTTMYINGVKETVTRTGTFANVGGTFTSVRNFRLGTDHGNTMPFAGELDDMMVFHYALNEQQVRTLYSTGGSKVMFGPATGAP